MSTKFPEYLYVNAQIEDPGKDQWISYHPEEHIDDSFVGNDTKLIAKYKCISVSKVQVEIIHERLIHEKLIKRFNLLSMIMKKGENNHG